jgi:hypothetical protein
MAGLALGQSFKSFMIAIAVGMNLLGINRGFAQTDGDLPSQSESKQAQTRRDVLPEQAFARLFSAIQTPAGSNRQLWDVLQQSGFVLSSVDRRSSFQFEYFVMGPAIKGPKDRLIFLRSVLQHDNGRCAWLFIDDADLPTGLFCHDRAFVLEGSKWVQKSDHHCFGFVVDASHPIDHSVPFAGPPDTPGYVRLELSSYLDELVKDQIPTTKWHSTSRTVDILKSNGTRAFVRFRSPNDQLRYGTALSELRIDASNAAIQCYRGFVTLPEPRIWLSSGDGERLAGRLEEVNRAIKPGEGQKGKSLFLSGNEAACRFWREIMPVWSDPMIGLRVGMPRHTVIELRELNMATMLNAERVFVHEESPTRVDWNLVNMMVCGCLENACYALNNYRSASETFPEDPVMIAREIESTIGPWEFRTLYTTVARQLLESPLLLEDQRYAMLHTLGMCGAPPTGVIQFAELMADDVFADAILRSHWQWTCDEKHVKACITLLGNIREGSPREKAAIETLVRLDAVNRVPDAVMNRWFHKRVVNDSIACHRLLTLLSAQPSGRAFLLEWLEHTRNDETLAATRQSIVTILHARAEATLRTERFEFISKAECHRLGQLDAGE